MNPQAKLTITSDTTITGLTAPSYQKGTKPVKVQFLLNGLPVLTKSASECFKVQTRSNTKLPEHRGRVGEVACALVRCSFTDHVTPPWKLVFGNNLGTGTTSCLEELLFKKQMRQPHVQPHVQLVALQQQKQMRHVTD